VKFKLQTIGNEIKVIFIFVNLKKQASEIQVMVG